MRNAIVVITCDLCGIEGPDLSTDRVLRLDNREVALDLCPAHLAELLTVVEAYLEKGTPARRAFPIAAAPRMTSSKVARRDPEQTTAIRAWAKENGYAIADRGRIPADVEKAYNFRGTAHRVAS